LLKEAILDLEEAQKIALVAKMAHQKERPNPEMWFTFNRNLRMLYAEPVSRASIKRNFSK